MKQIVAWRNAWFVVSIAGLLVLWMTVAATTQPNAASTLGVPAFLQAGRCYRFTFPITGAPNWKVLDVLDAGWVKAEVDAGPASARREPVWINIGQLITVHEARCSG
jgi:hypothetical protein